MNGLNFDPWQFAGSKARPVSAKTHITWNDFERMNVQRRKQVQERRLPCPAWALSDVLLRSLLVAYVEARTLFRKTNGSLLERRDVADKRLKKRIPGWNATIDRLQLEYVAGQKDGTSKERLDRLEEQIENLDTLIRITRKGTLAFLAAIVVLYYRMGKNSVEVGEEVGAKPPHVRQILFGLSKVWRKNFQIEFMLEHAVEPAAQFRSYTREQIDEMLADGKISIPKDVPPLEPPPALPSDLSPELQRTAPALKGESSATRRARLKAAGLCAYCGLRERGEYSHCAPCRAMFAAYAKKQYVPRTGSRTSRPMNAVANAKMTPPSIRGPKPSGQRRAPLLPGETEPQRRLRLKSSGLCTFCGLKEGNGYAMCADCRKNWADKSRAEIHAVKEKGLCAMCRKRPRGEHAECEVCRAKRTEDYRKKKAARLASRPAQVQNSNQEQIAENLDQAQFALCNA